MAWKRSSVRSRPGPPNLSAHSILSHNILSAKKTGRLASGKNAAAICYSVGRCGPRLSICSAGQHPHRFALQSHRGRKFLPGVSCATGSFPAIPFSGFSVFLPPLLLSQSSNHAPASPVDENLLATMRGSVHPLARPEFDQGAVPDDFPVRRMLVMLQRPPEREAARQRFCETYTPQAPQCFISG